MNPVHGGRHKQNPPHGFERFGNLKAAMVKLAQRTKALSNINTPMGLAPKKNIREILITADMANSPI